MEAVAAASMPGRDHLKPRRRHVVRAFYPTATPAAAEGRGRREEGRRPPGRGNPGVARRRHTGVRVRVFSGFSELRTVPKLKLICDWGRFGISALLHPESSECVQLVTSIYLVFALPNYGQIIKYRNFVSTSKIERTCCALQIVKTETGVIMHRIRINFLRTWLHSKRPAIVQNQNRHHIYMLRIRINLWSVELMH